MIASVTRIVGRAGLVLQKHAPEILTGLAVVGTVSTAVVASKATLKLAPITEEYTILSEASKEDLAEGGIEVKDHQRNMTILTVQATKKIVKLYAPAASLGLLTIGCIVGAHGIMRQRNVALLGAYKLMEKGYSDYRARVREEVGEEKDFEFANGVTTQEIVNEETGKTETVKVVNNPNAISPYARFFDEGNSNWSKTPEYNLLFLRSQQNYANDILQARGHLFLNEVYDSLGLPRTQAGQAVGWTISKTGDNFVDFGIYDQGNERAREFVNGNERSILLDFNVDGVIMDLI